MGGVEREGRRGEEGRGPHEITRSRSRASCPTATTTQGSAALITVCWGVWARKAAPPTSDPGLTTADSGRLPRLMLGRSLRRWPCRSPRAQVPQIDRGWTERMQKGKGRGKTGQGHAPG